MATLLIILLGTMLIQGSTLARSMHANIVHTHHARADAAQLWRQGLWMLSALTLCSVWGYGAQRLNHWRSDAVPDTELLVIVLGMVVLGVAAQKWFRATVQHQLNHDSLLTVLVTNSALLGLALFSARFAETLWDAFGYGLFSGITLTLLSACFDALRERLDGNDLPLAFRGIPIALITTGFMALALLGFVGLVRN